jgi:hypothetical protein
LTAKHFKNDSKLPYIYLNAKDHEMPSTIQYALGLEALVNVASATAIIFYPNFCLLKAFPRSILTITIPASTTTLFQICGTLIYTLTAPLLLSIPDGPHAAYTRRVTYYTLGAGEVFMIALFLQKGLGKVNGSGFGDGFMLGAVGSLAPICLWRAWCLWGNPNLLGVNEGEEGKKVKKG